MLPLHCHDTAHKPAWSLKEKILGWLRLILSDTNSRNLFMFLIINLSFAFVELSYGIWTNSLGLISDSFHMFFDCTALLTGLIASLVSKWRADSNYSYGYVRAEILGGFVNGLLLIFVAFFIFSEAIERLAEPPEIKHDRLLLVSVLGFVVNIIGIFVFQHGGSHHGHSHGGKSDNSHSDVHSHSHLDSHGHNHIDAHGHSHADSYGHSHADSHGHSHHNNCGHGHSNESVPSKKGGNKIMQGVFLHIMADTLGSIGVIISSSLINAYNWMIADPICSLFIAILIVLSVIPLIRDSVGILMMRTPKEIEQELISCYHRVKSLEEVYSVQDPHFWTLCSDVYVGTVKLEVSPKADLKYIQSQTHSIFYNIGVRQLFVQIDVVYL